jgi:cell division protein FtsL
MAPPPVPKATRLTSRAAVLAVVICAIALSLAYPVREYIAQRRQIDDLVAEQQMMQAQVKSLVAKRNMYSDPAYIEQVAEEELHMCLPKAQCYIIENGQSVIGVPKQAQPASAPWYAKLWHSVQQSDTTPPATAPVAGSPAASHPAVGQVTASPAASASPAAGAGKAGAGKAGAGSGTR